MSRTKRRKAMLGAIVALLIMVVLADRLGLLGRADDADHSAVTAQERYLVESQSLAEMQAIVIQRQEVAQALAESELAWRKAMGQMISATTPQLAEAQFREQVLTVLSEMRVNTPRVTSATRRTGGGQQVEPLILDVQFGADAPDTIFRVIDRIENMPDVATNIASVLIAGPGRMQQPRPIEVTLQVEALAFVGQEASGG